MPVDVFRLPAVIQSQGRFVAMTVAGFATSMECPVAMMSLAPVLMIRTIKVHQKSATASVTCKSLAARRLSLVGRCFVFNGRAKQ
jgi:hypothetical protein